MYSTTDAKFFCYFWRFYQYVICRVCDPHFVCLLYKLRLFRSINFYWIVNLHKNSAREGNNFTNYAENMSGGSVGGGFRDFLLYKLPSACAFLRSDASPHVTRWSVEIQRKLAGKCVTVFWIIIWCSLVGHFIVSEDTCCFHQGFIWLLPWI